MNTFVISDIHGQLDEFKRLLEKANYKHGLDRLFILGDMIDWGPKSLETLRFCYEMMMEYPKKVKITMGNHEMFMQYSLRYCNMTDVDLLRASGDMIGMVWTDYRNGGHVTLEQLQKLSVDERKEYYKMIESISENLRFESTLTIANNKRRRFYMAHACPTFATESVIGVSRGVFYDAPIKNMTALWERVEPWWPVEAVIGKKRSKTLKNKGIEPWVIVGHTITQKFNSYDKNGKVSVKVGNNVLFIDTGGKGVGRSEIYRLALINLKDMSVLYSDEDAFIPLEV